ncbi:MAG: IS1634 family transposase [Pseudomonadota bacterium]|nr:IS1634 family transposase [Pseudomonadota bacterium]
MDTRIKQVEILPLIKYYMDELGLVQLFAKYVPNTSMEIAPAQVLSMMVMNIMVSATPLYRMEDWLHDYLDGVTEGRFEAAKYNDDRLGRNLDILFDTDRSSLMTELSANAIRAHQLETQEIHNDSTSVTFIGDYDGVDPKAVNITYGYNKDHRPDCKQIVFGLNITGDGHIPLSYQLYDGNQADVTTHVGNWEQLREMLGKEDFIYVADSKLCSYENLRTIAENGGLFITVVPRNFREVKGFRERVREGEEIEWQHQHQVPDSRKKGRTQNYRIHVGERMDEGYRILWIHSKAKEGLERKARENRICKSEQALEVLSSGLNQRFLKTREQIELAIKKATKGASAYLLVTIHEERTTEKVQIGKGRPGPNTRYKEKEVIHYQLEWARDEEEIRKMQRSDGLFPLVDNTSLEPVEVLRTYKDQPYLEKRFNTHKSVLEVAPVFLETPRRIEAMMFLYFIALMLVSLIERRIRLEMQEQEIESLPMRPAGMHTKKPTWRTIVDTFHGVHLATIEQSGKTIHTALKGLSTLRRQILALLKVPIETYTRLCDRWWEYAIE